MTRTLLIVSALTYALLLFINWPQLSDPLIRHDDYPAFFGHAEAYYGKTLTEGRWLNYWWMSRETMWPANFAFLHYLLGWALFCAAVATSAFARDARLIYVALTAFLIALSPQAYLISAWFNTLGLGIWIVAIFAILTLYVGSRGARVLMLFFGPISMLAYTTYPLAMSALLFARHDTRRSIWDVLLLLLLLAVSMMLGLLIIYTLNYHYHGIFGLEIAEWRNPDPARGLADLWANAQIVLPFYLEEILTSMGFGIAWISAMNMFLLVAAMAILIQQRTLEPVYLLVGLAAAVGVLMANSLKEGVDIPMRAMFGAWVFFALILARAVFVLSQTGRAKPVLLGAAALTAFYTWQLQKSTWFYSEWLTGTRALAAQLPEDAEKFVIYGNLWALPGANEARIAHFYALSARLTQLTGLPGINCDDALVTCLDTPPFDIEAHDNKVLIRQVDGTVFLRMPVLEGDENGFLRKCMRCELDESASS